LLLGYLGAMLAGLSVGMVGAFIDASPAAVASAASPVGIAAGLMAFSAVWFRPVAAKLARVRSSR
jgi:hypothetical protein